MKDHPVLLWIITIIGKFILILTFITNLPYMVRFIADSRQTHMQKFYILYIWYSKEGDAQPDKT